jgi:hypothetical protein
MADAKAIAEVRSSGQGRLYEGILAEDQLRLPGAHHARSQVARSHRIQRAAGGRGHATDDGEQIVGSVGYDRSYG